MSPTDLTPEQIADALQALAKRDSVSIHVSAKMTGAIDFHVFEWMDAYQFRDGTGATYAAALSACRAAEFGKAGGE